MKIKKGDTVKILYGKDSGKTGLVVAVDQKKRSVIIEGLNLYKRHLKGDGRTRTSEIVTIEKPFPVSKVMFVCPICKKTTRLSTRKDGKKVVRICKKCGKEIVEQKEEITEKSKKETTKETKIKKVNKE